jgi:hypothetical protein
VAIENPLIIVHGDTATSQVIFTEPNWQFPTATIALRLVQSGYYLDKVN